MVGSTAEIEEGWTLLAELQRQGKVRWLGVSNFNVSQLERCSAARR
ncbi:aldo/keto reductase [Corallococcus terminator]|nr:aldo/keto reductase [Corallococcus terminator]